MFTLIYHAFARRVLLEDLKVPVKQDATQSTTAPSNYCTKTVERLKRGPADIQEVLCKNEAWHDDQWMGIETLVDDRTTSTALTASYNLLVQ